MNSTEANVLPYAGMTQENKQTALDQKILTNGLSAGIGRNDFYAISVGYAFIFVPVQNYEEFSAAFLAD